jgi:hypothetical protein
LASGRNDEMEFLNDFLCSLLRNAIASFMKVGTAKSIAIIAAKEHLLPIRVFGSDVFIKPGCIAELRTILAWLFNLPANIRKREGDEQAPYQLSAPALRSIASMNSFIGI